MNKPTLRNNQDGTCNCKSLGNGCFFQELDGSRCGCKCHTKPTFETTQCTFESDKWKGELVTLLNRKGLDHLPTENIYEDITDFISNLLAEQNKEILANYPQAYTQEEIYKYEKEVDYFMALIQEVKSQVRKDVVEEVENVILKQYPGRASLDKNSPVWIERDVLIKDLEGITLKN